MARRRARLQIRELRTRLHDFGGSEFAGQIRPGRRLPDFAEELRATVWTLKQDAPTVVGLIGFLTDWAWRYAQEYQVTLRLKLPVQAVRPRPVDFEVAEAFQAHVRVAMSHLVEHLGARALDLVIAQDGRILKVEVQAPAVASMPRTDVRSVSASERPPGREDPAVRLQKLRNQFRAVGGQWAMETSPPDGLVLRAECTRRKTRRRWKGSSRPPTAPSGAACV